MHSIYHSKKFQHEPFFFLYEDFVPGFPQNSWKPWWSTAHRQFVNHVKADGSINKLRTPNTVSAQATQLLRVFGGGQSVGGVIIATVTRSLSLLFHVVLLGKLTRKSALQDTHHRLSTVTWRVQSLQNHSSNKAMASETSVWTCLVANTANENHLGKILERADFLQDPAKIFFTPYWAGKVSFSWRPRSQDLSKIFLDYFANLDREPRLLRNI